MKPTSEKRKPSHRVPDAREQRFDRSKNHLSRLWAVLGPGFISGASDDDPSGIGTYAAAGSAFGYATLWIAVVTYPMMAVVQFMCSKIGMVTGRGLAGVLRHHDRRALLYAAVFALFVANTINAGADVGAMADGIRLLVPIPVKPAIVLIAVVIVLLQIFGSYKRIVGIFRWLTLSLFAFIGSVFLARPDPGATLRGTLLPTFHMDRPFVAMVVALLGTTISPYLFFWEASQEVEEEITVGRTQVRSRHGATPRELRLAALDVNCGMLFSNLIMYFIILACAATLHRAGKTHIETAAEAAQALRPLAGDGATSLLALGMIGAGLLAVPILTGSAAYAIAEVFGWRHSLSARPRQAKPFYVVIALSTGLGLLVNYLGIKPFDALVGAAILNGILAPPMLVLIMRLSNDPRVMGEHTNSRLMNVLGWATTGVMFLAATALLLMIR